jgi:hypothetical protein
MMGAMRHNSRPVIVAFSFGSARAKAGGERYYYQTGGESGRLAKRHGLIPLAAPNPLVTRRAVSGPLRSITLCGFGS